MSGLEHIDAAELVRRQRERLQPVAPVANPPVTDPAAPGLTPSQYPLAPKKN